MSGNYKKWIWGGLGWAIGGPIGAILGYSLGSINPPSSYPKRATMGGDFLTSLFLSPSLLFSDDKANY